jgi:hypothetical protein
MRDYVGASLSNERSQLATLTDVSSRDTTGEVVGTLADSHTIYIHAPTLYDLAVGDKVWVRKMRNVGARARYEIVGLHVTSSGSYIPKVRGASGGTLDDLLTDDSGNILTDDSFNFLTQD